MSDRLQEEPGDEIGFPGGWRGLYIFVIVYGILQIALLYWFTVALNRS
jgi:hypothetical protein